MTPSKVALVRGATSDAGEWRFSGLPPGTYVIGISAHSLETYTGQINVTLQAVTRLDVVLKVPKEIWTGPVAEPVQLEEPLETPFLDWIRFRNRSRHSLRRLTRGPQELR